MFGSSPTMLPRRTSLGNNSYGGVVYSDILSMSGFGGGTFAESHGGESQLNSTSKSTKNRLGLVNLEGRDRKQSLVSTSAGALPHWGYATVDTPTLTSLSPTNRASSTIHTQLFGQTPLASANTPRLNAAKFKFLDRAGGDYPLEGGGYGSPSSPHTRPTTATSFNSLSLPTNRDNSRGGGPLSCSSGNSSLQSPVDRRLNPPKTASPLAFKRPKNSQKLLLQPALFPGDDNDHYSPPTRSPSSSSSFLSPVEGGEVLEAAEYNNSNSQIPSPQSRSKSPRHQYLSLIGNKNHKNDGDFSDACSSAEDEQQNLDDRHNRQQQVVGSPPRGRTLLGHTPPPTRSQEVPQKPSMSTTTPPPQPEDQSGGDNRSLPPFLAVPVVLSLLRPKGTPLVKREALQ